MVARMMMMVVEVVVGQHDLPEDGGVAEQECGGRAQHGVGEEGRVGHHQTARA